MDRPVQPDVLKMQHCLAARQFLLAQDRSNSIGYVAGGRAASKHVMLQVHDAGVQRSVLGKAGKCRCSLTWQGMKDLA